ncbi:hypothetical protein B9Z19DRAFT_1081473 [Tuber borchii]|uniref:Hydrophobin n=1 Tax=Tuber borchii TaxID=42251 RepID=A0A2T6ZVP1_TUBBO|nr:hypothetical protein B9Z19DRAFT_1081473 [Tuber borchii]
MKTLKCLLLLFPFVAIARSTSSGAGAPVPVCHDTGIVDYTLSLSLSPTTAPERRSKELPTNRTTDGELFRRVVGGIAVAVLVAVV